MAKTSHPGAHVVVVNATFKSEDDKMRWKTRWGLIAEMTYADEPNCLACEFFDDTEDPTKAIIFARFASKDDLDGPHQETLKKAKETVPQCDPAVEIVEFKPAHFQESNLGHMDRAVPSKGGASKAE